MLMFIEIFLKTYHMQPIVSFLHVGLLTIIIYPKYAFENIFKFPASRMNRPCEVTAVRSCLEFAYWRTWTRFLAVYSPVLSAALLKFQ